MEPPKSLLCMNEAVLDVHEMYFEDRHLSTENFVRDAFKDDISPGGRPFWRTNVRFFTYVQPGADVPKISGSIADHRWVDRVIRPKAGRAHLY